MTLHRRDFLKQVSVGTMGLGFAAALPSGLAAPPNGRKSLPRSTPEDQGVSSRGILAFLEGVDASKCELHSFMMLRHGQVIAEGWWSPYRAELNHMLYSLSKSFTSTAVGLAIAEGKLRVEDRIISFFPDKLPETVSENLAALRVKDLLTMSVGHAEDSTGAIRKGDDWVKNFLALPIPHRPGSIFLYNSGATYMLSAIVQKVTGQTVLEYLTPRLFQPLGIEGMTWETCPRGINTGGWGLSLRTEALAKFGQLYLQKGVWNGRQVLPAAWVEEATSFKIQQSAPNLERAKQSSDWHQGYCYQFWRCRHNAFRGDGAFGQFMVVMPEQDAVVVITGENSDLQGVLNLVWKHLLPAMEEEPLTADRKSRVELKRALSHVALLPSIGHGASPLAAQISGKAFRLEANDLCAQSVSLRFKHSECLFTVKDDNGEYAVRCGSSTWIEGETSMPGTPPNLVERRGRCRSKVAACGVWKDNQTYEMTWRYIETPHHDTVTCRFDAGRVRVEFLNSISAMTADRKDKRPVLQGKLLAKSSETATQ